MLMVKPVERVAVPEGTKRGCSQLQGSWGAGRGRHLLRICFGSAGRPREHPWRPDRASLVDRPRWGETEQPRSMPEPKEKPSAASAVRGWQGPFRGQ